MRKFKGKAYMNVTVQGVVKIATFKRVMYQIMEYKTIFDRFPEYPDPLEYGFMEIGEGIITLTLNKEFEEGATFYGRLSESTIKDFNNKNME